MKIRLRSTLPPAVVALLAAAFADGGAKATACAANDVRPCSCADGSSGTQICGDAGDGYGARAWSTDAGTDAATPPTPPPPSVALTAPLSRRDTTRVAQS